MTEKETECLKRRISNLIKLKRKIKRENHDLRGKFEFSLSERETRNFKGRLVNDSTVDCSVHKGESETEKEN